jgi:hypothetical protein
MATSAQRPYRPSRPPSAFARELARARGEPVEVLDAMRAATLSGDAAPGVPIPVEENWQVFGASPIPVREAPKTLIGEGLVDHCPRGGYTVARITVAELSELYVVRGVLEQAALAAALPLAAEADHEEARAAHDEVGRALAERDLPCSPTPPGTTTSCAGPSPPFPPTGNSSPGPTPESERHARPPGMSESAVRPPGDDARHQ